MIFSRLIFVFDFEYDGLSNSVCMFVYMVLFGFIVRKFWYFV